MATRRAFLQRTAFIAATGGGVWLLHETVIEPPPRVRFSGIDGWSGWCALAAGPAIPIIRLTLQGVIVSALIDSGAQRSVVDEALSARLGLEDRLGVPMIAVGISGGVRIGRTVRIDATVGGLIIRHLTAAVIDLSPLSLAGAGAVGVVLGQDILRQVRLDLDLSRRRLALRRRGQAVTGTRNLAARAKGGALYAPVTVEGAAVEALVDTGASAVLALSSQAADAAGLLDDDHPIRFNRSVTFGGVGWGKELIVETLVFADRTFERTAVQIYPAGRGGILPGALLGVGALDAERFLIDLGAGTLSRVP